ncbi:DUF2971 domain-containing protein [Nitrosomonas sp.]|uniref:DUF2971 domain-containing protein n=1 Tax=Nitrosomonas sp. TaxID=42353 RepID=UPI002726EB01|nr:DUF2971 domain-containing protein [Nitrosomonas sp.]MDO8893456.1 DUF2971 domain-containing protein [Nitrosomonas sp.]
MTKSLAEVHPELFHYTNAKGLIGIIESQSIWATHYAYLNDSEEIRCFLKNCLPDLLRDAGNKYLDELIAQVQSTQLRIDRQGGRKKIIDSFIGETQRVHEKILLKDALAEPYIASFFTTSGLEKGVSDQVAQHGLLSQWRGYGNEDGYAIVFDTKQFCELLKDVGEKMKNSMHAFFADVVYSSDPAFKFIKEFEEDLIVIKDFFGAHLNGREKNLDKIYFSLMHCACRYKHWGFREENEVRVVVLPYPLHHEAFYEDMKIEGITVGEISRKHFFRAGALVPYIDLFDGVTSIADKKTLPIKRIIVGPTKNDQEKNRRINAVKMLINQHGIKADVTASDIPFVG